MSQKESDKSMNPIEFLSNGQFKAENGECKYSVRIARKEMPYKTISVHYKNNFNSESMLSNEVVSDGTLYFTYEAIRNVILNALSLAYDENKAVVLGDVLISSETGSFGTKEKPWLCDKTVVRLPYQLVEE